MAAAFLPLLGARDLDAPLAWRRGTPISARHFLADAAAVARTIPASARGVIDLCPSRYDFAVVMAAALARGLPTLMPPNAMASTLALVQREHAGAWIVEKLDTPGAAPPEGMPAITEPPLIDARQLAAVLLTSGSTGVPVPHGRTWASVVANAQAQASRMAAALGRESLHGLTLVATVPAQHSYGFESSVTLALLGGAAFDDSRPFYPADIVDALERVPRPRALVTTPFHLKTLLAAGIAALPGVDVIFSATAPLSPQLAAQAEAALGGPLFEVYGCTEAGQVATRRTTASPTWTTYGELRITRQHDDRVRGNDGADGDAVEVHGKVEVYDNFEVYHVHGGHVFEPTPLADILELDDDRHFRLLGRSGDLIHVAGKRSSLGHLNHHLNSIPGVDDGAFWMPDDDEAGGITRPVAFVVAPTLDAAAVARALHERIDAVFVPRRIVLLDALPHNETGKITAATLRDLARRHGLR
jgi:acyl-coenzyme A synthetase/AMP-(fatty) acid ligase